MHQAAAEAEALAEVDCAKAASLTVVTDFCSIHVCIATRLNSNCAALSCFVFQKLATKVPKVINQPGLLNYGFSCILQSRFANTNFVAAVDAQK